MKIHKSIIYYIISKLFSASESMWQSGHHHYPRFDQNALMNQNKRWIYTCLDLRAMTAVKTPLRVFATKRKGENLLPKTRAVPKGLLNKLQERAHLNRWTGKDVEIEEIVDDNNALYRLVNNFNTRDTRASIITIMMEQLDLVGNSYFVIEWNRALRVPEALWPTYPQHMTALVGKGKEKDAIIGYEYRRGADTTTYKPEEILHIKAPDPNNLVYGTGILEKIVDTLILDGEMYEHAKAIFRNQGSPSMLFTPEGEPVAPDQKKRIDTDLKQNFGGSRKAGVVGFMNEKLRVQIISQTLQDLSYIQGREIIQREIAAAFHVPESFLKTENVNKANAEVGEIMLPRYAVEPRLTQIEEAINKDLVALFDDRLFVAFDSPVPDDRVEDRKDDMAYLKFGVYSPNEVRARHGLEPREGGDVFLTDLTAANMANFGNIGIGDGEGNEPKTVKKKGMTQEERETRWKRFDAELTRWETKIIRKCRELFSEMYREVLDRVEGSGYEPNQVAVELSAKADDPDNIIDAWMFGSRVWEERFEGGLMPIIKGIFIKGGEDALDDLVAGISIDLDNPHAVSWFGKKEIKIREIVDTDKARLRKSLTEGIEAGDNINELKKRVEEELEYARGPRSITIARTESAGAYNGGAFEGARQSEVANTKDWLATMDDRVRDSHAAMNGERVPIDQPFSNGLMYPGDQNGSAEQIIQCRCTVIYGAE